MLLFLFAALFYQKKFSNRGKGAANSGRASKPPAANAIKDKGGKAHLPEPQNQQREVFAQIEHLKAHLPEPLAKAKQNQQREVCTNCLNFKGSVGRAGPGG